MAASGNTLEIEEKKPELPEDSVIDVVPFEPLPPSVARIVADYAWMTPLEKPTLFSGANSTLEKILFLAEHAGPLDRFKYLLTLRSSS